MRGIGAVFAAVAICAGATGASAQPPVEAFGSLPFIAEPQLSPDGKHFAGIQDLDGKPAAVIYAVNSSAAAQVFASQENLIIAGITWAKNDRLVMVEKVPIIERGSAVGTEYRALSVDVGGGSWASLFGNNHSARANITSAIIDDKNLDDPNTILMPLWTHSVASSGYDYRLSLYKVDVHTGHAEVLQEGGMKPGYWITDGEGGVVGRVDLTQEPLVEHLMLYRKGQWDDVREFDGSEDRGAHVFGLSFDTKSIVVLASNAVGRGAMVRLDRDSGATGAVLFENPDYDVALALTDDWTGRVIGAAYAGDKMEYVYFEPARQALQRGIEQVFPGADAHAVSVTQAGDKAIVAVQSPSLPPTYYFLDRDSHVASKIASEYPGLTAADLGAMKPYPFKARDGMAIPAYLTLPPGKPAKNLPLVVMPHGGPDARDRIGFDWWAQFLANRGYAVFQPNFRGSRGYGRAFDAAGFHQWGLKMQDDVTDGVKALIADGTADPRRICIVGASYGGYAALAGATFTPDLYACAASIAGISDLGKMMTMVRSGSGGKSQTMSFWVSRIGSRDEDEPRLEATSPALHAEQVRGPVLLMHGKLDTTVPFAQSEEERDALVHAGKRVELVTFDGDDHYFSLAATRIKMLSTLERFLKENIGN